MIRFLKTLEGLLWIAVFISAATVAYGQAAARGATVPESEKELSRREWKEDRSHLVYCDVPRAKVTRAIVDSRAVVNTDQNGVRCSIDGRRCILKYYVAKGLPVSLNAVNCPSCQCFRGRDLIEAWISTPAWGISP